MLVLAGWGRSLRSVARGRAVNDRWNFEIGMRTVTSRSTAPMAARAALAVRSAGSLASVIAARRALSGFTQQALRRSGRRWHEALGDEPTTRTPRTMRCCTCQAPSAGWRRCTTQPRGCPTPTSLQPTSTSPCPSAAGLKQVTVIAARTGAASPATSAWMPAGPPNRYSASQQTHLLAYKPRSTRCPPATGPAASPPACW